MLLQVSLSLLGDPGCSGIVVEQPSKPQLQPQLPPPGPVWNRTNCQEEASSALAFSFAMEPGPCGYLGTARKERYSVLTDLLQVSLGGTCVDQFACPDTTSRAMETSLSLLDRLCHSAWFRVCCSRELY